MRLVGQKGQDAKGVVEVGQMLQVLPIPQHSHYQCFLQQSAQSAPPLDVTAPVQGQHRLGGRSEGIVGSLKHDLSCCCCYSFCWTWNASFEKRAVAGGVEEEGHSSSQKWRQNQKRRYSLTPEGGPGQVQTEELPRTRPAAVVAVVAGADEAALAVDAVAVVLNQGL